MNDGVRDALERSLRERFGRDRRILSLERRPSAYRTSFALEVLDVGLDDGTKLAVMFKDLGLSSLTEEARQAKPGFLHDPLREIETYRHVLDSADLGTATFYGADVERHWLFMEKVRGVELFQVGELDTWAEVARWAARMHGEFQEKVASLAGPARLLRYDRGLILSWLDRARRFGGDPAARLVDRLTGHYEELAEELLALPPTFIHGELYASNVIVDRTSGGLRVCPVDWELAASGPGALDLAALTAGDWKGAERQTIEDAYREAGGNASERALDLCRLHQAVQWLGWSPDWSPPTEHSLDWVAEGERHATRLGL